MYMSSDGETTICYSSVRPQHVLSLTHCTVQSAKQQKQQYIAVDRTSVRRQQRVTERRRWSWTWRREARDHDVTPMMTSLAHLLWTWLSTTSCLKVRLVACRQDLPAETAYLQSHMRIFNNSDYNRALCIHRAATT